MARRQSADPLERLDTPAWVTRALLYGYPDMGGQTIIEPCAGSGMMVDVLKENTDNNVLGYDIAPRRGDIHESNTTSIVFWTIIAHEMRERRELWAVVTNPPFSLATVLLKRIFQVDAKALVCLLLRLSWLEAVAERADAPDPDAIIVVPRPKFIESPQYKAAREAAGKAWGGDNVTCAWCIWNHRSQWLSKHPIQRLSRATKAELDV